MTDHTNETPLTAPQPTLTTGPSHNSHPDSVVLLSCQIPGAVAVNWHPLVTAHRFDRTRPWVPPQRATQNSAAFDLFAASPAEEIAVTQDPLFLRPGITALRFLLNFRLQFHTPSPGSYALILDRSNVRSKGVSLLNPGLIDSDYPGEVIAGPFHDICRWVQEKRNIGIAHSPDKAVAQMLLTVDTANLLVPVRLRWAAPRMEEPRTSQGFGSTDPDQVRARTQAPAHTPKSVALQHCPASEHLPCHHSECANPGRRQRSTCPLRQHAPSAVQATAFGHTLHAAGADPVQVELDSSERNDSSSE